MSVTEAQRLTLRTSLVAAIGEPATDVLMEAMPPIDYDNLATKADVNVLRTDLNVLRADMDARFTKVDARFVALSAELRGEMAELRGELRGEMAELRGEMAEIRGETKALGGDLRSEMASQTRILVGTHIASMLGFAGLILGFG